ncbi:membrane protein of unknown function [Methanoculleus bourgensis]|uniref:Heparan-alpha-glucosaminide N-acetyltransferase catalytic domain-containing protein n=1 Tax=Methanoculleus bourgensis TaxID=83986 RepID=A0A0X3BMQ6_9EURY|nr:membrane protein of unknown function [Methanoculleus bourgensis]
MPAERYWEIDLARGIAVVTMIVFHSAFDLNFFGVLPLNVSGGFLRMLAYLTASAFIFIVGVSFTISYARAERRLARRDLALKYIRRGLGIFSLGLVITAVTWLFLPSVYIVFGILHFIGIAILLAPLFVRFGTTNLILGTAASSPATSQTPSRARGRSSGSGSIRHRLRASITCRFSPGLASFSSGCPAGTSSTRAESGVFRSGRQNRRLPGRSRSSAGTRSSSTSCISLSSSF